MRLGLTQLPLGRPVAISTIMPHRFARAAMPVPDGPITKKGYDPEHRAATSVRSKAAPPPMAPREGAAQATPAIGNVAFALDEKGWPVKGSGKGHSRGARINKTLDELPRMAIPTPKAVSQKTPPYTHQGS